jgi:urate oxidase
MTLTANRYGKSRIRLVKVRRERESHEIVDLTIDVQLEGEFDAVYAAGDNSSCIATDTMKNTVYALARGDEIRHPETFAIRLARHFVAQPAVSLARVAATEHRWDRVAVDGRGHPHAFMQPCSDAWTTEVVADHHDLRVTSGLVNLVLLKTAESAFSGFPRDRYTTLRETDERLLATSVTASWRYRPDVTDFSIRARVREALVETFAVHDSRSVQHTLYAMAEAALARCPDIMEITLRLPNRHHLLVDLTPFGLDNPNQIFVATDEPYGLIEATITRD